MTERQCDSGKVLKGDVCVKGGDQSVNKKEKEKRRQTQLAAALHCEKRGSQCTCEGKEVVSGE